jgi:hypothetical protein
VNRLWHTAVAVLFGLIMLPLGVVEHEPQLAGIAAVCLVVGLPILIGAYLRTTHGP